MINNLISRRKRVAQSFLSVAVFALIVCLASWSGLLHANDGLFQSPLPGDGGEGEEGVSPSWIWSHEGGTRQFGPVLVNLPPAFTNQSGANVIGDMLVESLFVDNLANLRLLQGTEIALGIWPENDQTDFQKSIEIRITIDSAKLTQGVEDRLTLMMYNPETEEWQQLSSQFQKATLEIVASVQSFKPVHKDFPNWGGRTFFGVFEQTSTPTPRPKPTSTPRLTATRKPTEISVPTYTPFPTYTPYPTSTPYPTYTPLLSPTLIATLTAHPPQESQATISPSPTAIPTKIPEGTSASKWVYLLGVGVFLLMIVGTIAILWLIISRKPKKA